MPYRWTPPAPDGQTKLTLWPHNSLPPKGLAAFVLATFVMLLVPLSAVLGTVLLWGLLPFLLLALFGMWYALEKNGRDRQILEVLTLDPTEAHLVRRDPRGPERHWNSNTYWVSVSLHENGGPVPFYVTLKGSGREVEIGAFLSEDERKALYADLSQRIRQLARP
ncbi:DUF2244 domain-containing protein [Pseudoprimorskyibacter insulae]|uniref:Integral membrane protein n=1 Tax=Pseudoprimorskyibacter insulae TaxID=1695997 RepID=A0A2R8AQX2_9RHOB|nr:DUF2244 domain-containing protein [Pseudoprimorskyibacter insulae]SPF78471.1 hypothetical protein PRI8871_01074 [Pseudoprimorskyibacter insulae]